MINENKIEFCADGNILFKLGAIAVTINNKIYIKKSYWNSLSYNMKEALLVHETVHLEQQKKTGAFWLLKYFTSRKFRLEQEVEGYGSELKYRVALGENKLSLLESFANLLSGKVYMNMTDYDTAYKKLEEYVK